MTKIYCFILLSLCSQAYGQISLDSAAYYSLMSNALWIHEDRDVSDSLSGRPCGPGTQIIDAHCYWVNDSHCMRFPLAYELQIKDSMFILHIKDTYIGMKFEFYIYGCFFTDSTLKMFESHKKVKCEKIKMDAAETYIKY